MGGGGKSRGGMKEWWYYCLFCLLARFMMVVYLSMFSILFAEFLQKIKTHHNDVCSHNKRKDKQRHTHRPPHTTLTPKAPFPALVITPLAHWLASSLYTSIRFLLLAQWVFFRLSLFTIIIILLLLILLFFSSTRN